MPSSDTSSLEERIKRSIALQGPMDLATFMAMALGDPKEGYYMSGDPFGKAGDFTTAPEVSQMFGELIGIWILDQWQKAECPSPFHLIELGPGRGTLMADMVRTLSQHPKAKEALSLHMVETSPSLQSKQQQALKGFTQQGIKARWHETIESLPKGAPHFIVANEFFDALPIHQWIFHKDKWHERIIGLGKDKNLAFGLGPVRDLGDKTCPEAPKDGAIWEHAPLASALCQTLARSMAETGGAALFIDYGYKKSALGDTLQALKAHQFADPLHAPGKQDMTAHVNFESLEKAVQTAAPSLSSVLTTQGSFLLEMGLLQRAGQLGTGKNHEEQESIRDAVERLAAPDQMGELFKVMAILPQGIDAPGFSN
jgi:SAM-dependent MidA family methyltransferase